MLTKTSWIPKLRYSELVFSLKLKVNYTIHKIPDVKFSFSAAYISAHNVMYEEAARIHPALQITTWIVYPIILILFSTYFVHMVAPNAIGK